MNTAAEVAVGVNIVESVKSQEMVGGEVSVNEKITSHNTNRHTFENVVRGP